MKPTEEQIKEIAEDLECGLKCYYNTKSGEIKSIIDFDRYYGADEELWEEDLNHIEENWDDYIEFTGFESHESFQIMADFAKSVDDEKLQYRLFNALNRRKPFQNFKWQIDNSGHYRQLWFNFRSKRYKDWVKEQIEIKENYFL